MATHSAPKFEQEIPDVLELFLSAEKALAGHGLDRKLIHLVKLRASQINRCAFCVKMHTREAREDGETSERLDRLVVWDQVSDYTPAEKAALAWTEALTLLDHKTDLGGLRAGLREYFSEEAVAALTASAAMINLWNRIGISRH